MTKRLEFSKKVRIEIFKRAGGSENLRCEGDDCGILLRGKPFEVDHTLECWEMEDIEHGLRPPLTAEDGKLLCIPCHQEKTGRKAGERAHGKRLVAKAARTETKYSRPIPGSKRSGLRKRMNGTVERW
jgi:hypothetical protein